MKNVGVSVKNKVIGVLVKMIVGRVLVHLIKTVIKHVKSMNIKLFM